MHLEELNKISNFSAVHKLQIPDMGEKGVALPIISNFTTGFFPSSFIFQMCPDRVVAFFLVGFLKSCLWFPQRSLNGSAVRPT